MDANEYALKVNAGSAEPGGAAEQRRVVGKSRRLRRSLLQFPFPPSRRKSRTATRSIEQDDRRYRIRGLPKNLSHELMKVNVLVSSRQDAFHVDTLDLYSARQRAAFTKQAAEELSVRKTLRKRPGPRAAEARRAAGRADPQSARTGQTGSPMSDEERSEALALLRIRNCWTASWKTSTLRHGGRGDQQAGGYLAAVSRHLESPLAWWCSRVRPPAKAR
jgi:hypothetical protein